MGRKDEGHHSWLTGLDFLFLGEPSLSNLFSFCSVNFFDFSIVGPGGGE
jgi:hypothetical protein